MSATNRERHTTAIASGKQWNAPGSPFVIALGALLVLQLLAALVLSLNDRDMDPAGTRGALLSFDRAQVTGIRIAGPNGEPVLVSKTDSGWVIPALGNLPAAENRVTELLTKLEGLEKSLPVATSAQALKRFKVAEDSFERRLTLEGGDTTLATLYLGDSPGFRRLFVRADGEGSVYEAELGLFDAPDTGDDWSDRTLLHLNTQEIRKLTLPALTLEKTENGWQLSDPAEGEEPDTQVIEERVRRLASIDFLGVFPAEATPSAIKDAPAIEIEATLTSGETINHRISKLEEGDDYLLEVSNRPQRFKLAAYAVEDLTNLERADFLVNPQEPEEEVSAAADSDTADADMATTAKEMPETAEPPVSVPTEAAPPTAAPEQVTPDGSSDPNES
jgi:hypothetical protein